MPSQKRVFRVFGKKVDSKGKDRKTAQNEGLQTP